jgi:predicted TIM-barrel fold metal-dependent hydrolase
VREAGAEIPMFSSDFPHVEGGRNPIKRFETTLDDASMQARDAFYRHNFAALMGRALQARGLTA